MENKQKLRKWLKDNDLPPTRWALSMSISPIQVTRIVNGDGMPSLKLATRFHKETGGAVPAHGWYWDNV